MQPVDDMHVKAVEICNQNSIMSKGNNTNEFNHEQSMYLQGKAGHLITAIVTF